jgi:hypothetical protein
LYHLQVGFWDGQKGAFESTHFSCTSSVLRLSNTSNVITATDLRQLGSWIYRVDGTFTADACQSNHNVTLRVIPNAVDWRGGTKLRLTGPCIPQLPTSNFTCIFHSGIEIEVKAEIINDYLIGVVQCTTPQLLVGTQTRISLQVKSGDSITKTTGVIQVTDFSTITPNNTRGPNVLAIVLGSVGGVILILLLAAGIVVGAIFLRRYMAERAIRERQPGFEMMDK